MDSEPTDELLRRLAEGDVDAAADLFEAYTPYLRAVVRRQLADRFRNSFDSIDVVQSVWARVVKTVGRDGLVVVDREHLKSILATIARRRVVDRVRRHSHDAAGERLGDRMNEIPHEGSARPSEIAQADDVWGRILAACPPEHREILRLRRDGMALQDIADRLGLHEGSVRRVIRHVGRELALDGTAE